MTNAADASIPDVSVVIPTFRRPELLTHCLDAVFAQTLPARRFEVIVVDDGREDPCKAMIERLAAMPGAPVLRYARSDSGRGPAVARNTGWRAASAPLVAFTDDDTVPDRDWLARGLAVMQAHPEWLAAAGHVEVPPMAFNALRLDALSAVLATAPAPTDHELMTRGLQTAEFVTANAFVRREALVQVDGFDERFQRAWREDSDLQFRLQALGPIGRAADARVLHPVRRERWGVSLRQQRNVYFDALLYRKHPAIYRARVRRIPPWDYYAVVGLTAAAVTAGIAGSGGFALAASAAAGLLVVRIARRRLQHTSHAPAHVWEMLCTSAAIPYLSVYWRMRGAWHFRTPFL